LSTRLDDSAIAVRYLLGELSEPEEKTFEDSFFADDDVFEDLKISEAEVIDAYIANELTQKQRKHLEQRLAASPRLQARVAFARTLSQAIAADKPVQHREGHDEPAFEQWWKRVLAVPLIGKLTPVGAVAAVLVVIALGVSVMQSIRLRNESRRLETESAELARQRDELAKLSVAERDRSASELRDAQARYERLEELVRSLQQGEPKPQPPKRAPVFASLILNPGATRSGGEDNELIIARTDTQVRLELVLLRADYARYQVTINGPANKQIHRAGLNAVHKFITLHLPATLFPPGQYTVRVNGVGARGEVELVSDYTFRVVRK
jgi:hypothetical protein